MRNVTLAIEEDVLQRARVRAAKERTSVNAVIRDFLKDYAAAEDRYRAAVEDLLRVADASPYDSGGRRWKRKDLYDRRALRGE